MFILANLLNAVVWLLGVLFTLAIWAIILRAVLSWVNPDPYHPLVRFLEAVTEPLLAPFRRFLPPWRTGGIDLSPLFAILAIKLLELFLLATLRDLAVRLAAS